MTTDKQNIAAIFDCIRGHHFHPIKDGFTYDRDLDKEGITDLEDKDWKVRTFAVRGLIRFVM